MTLVAAEAEKSEMSICSHSQIPGGKCYKDSCPSAWISSLQPTRGVPFKQEVQYPVLGQWNPCAPTGRRWRLALGWWLSRKEKSIELGTTQRLITACGSGPRGGTAFPPACLMGVKQLSETQKTVLLAVHRAWKGARVARYGSTCLQPQHLGFLRWGAAWTIEQEVNNEIPLLPPAKIVVGRQLLILKCISFWHFLPEFRGYLQTNISDFLALQLSLQ